MGDGRGKKGAWPRIRGFRTQHGGGGALGLMSPRPHLLPPPTASLTPPTSGAKSSPPSDWLLSWATASKAGLMSLSFQPKMERLHFSKSLEKNCSRFVCTRVGIAEWKTETHCLRLVLPAQPEKPAMSILHLPVCVLSTSSSEATPAPTLGIVNAVWLSSLQETPP